MSTGALVRYVVVFAVIVGCLAVGELLFKVGSTKASVSPHTAQVRALAMAGGMVLMIIQQVLVWLLFHWGLDASVVVPVCGLNFAVLAILGKIFLGEPVDAQRWAGIVAITIGAALVAQTQKAPGP
jgi:drug/metabolite transporter (DMT)-like permease